ncbi:MAG: aminotransferase class I/II-fold pyridoxal phosphate-dependent enzyme [Woeseia sp.]
MKIPRFEMERVQCLYENEVKFNLSESGVLPLNLDELLPDPDQRAALTAERLGYPHSMGRTRLRQNIAAFYGVGDEGSVTVTNGGSEANYMTLWGLLDKTDRAAFMIPNYLQGMGIGTIYGRQVDTYRLVMQKDAAGAPEWRLDLDSLKQAVKPSTKVIVVTNPNNPTGAVLNDAEMDAIVTAADRVGAWLVADEIYRGAEVDGPLTPTFAGRYDKVVITAGLSKAFGLPGLRTGWIVAPPKLIKHLVQYHDYLTLTPGYLSDYLADIVMEPARRDSILERTRSIVRSNLPHLEQWLASHDEILDFARPQAGAICMIRYRLPIASGALYNRFRRDRSVLVTPATHFGITGKYFRVGFGYELDHLMAGLKELEPPMAELQKRGRAAVKRRATA